LVDAEVRIRRDDGAAGEVDTLACGRRGRGEGKHACEEGEQTMERRGEERNKEREKIEERRRQQRKKRTLKRGEECGEAGGVPDIALLFACVRAQTLLHMTSAARHEQSRERKKRPHI